MRLKHVLIIIFIATMAIGIALRKRKESPHTISPTLPSDFRPRPEAPSTATCSQAYRRFYDKAIVEWRVVFGYKDARPNRFVGDRYERNTLIAYLLAPCPPDFFACSFQRNLTDTDLFTKEITGPDRKRHVIHLRVIHSSAGPDDDANRVDGFQTWRSENAKKEFLEGLKSADAIFYNGHSRNGGGPDFSPPLLLKNHHVDYSAYHRAQPGLSSVLKMLDAKEHRAKLLGLFSCASDRHFLAPIQKADKKLAVISSRKLLFHADAMKALLATLSSLIGQTCETEFNGRLGDSHVTGFFSVP